MPFYDRACEACGWTAIDVREPIAATRGCPTCGAATERAYLTGRMAAVIDDSWPGGKTFENLGHDPVTFYSKSDYRRELKARGLEEKVRHVGLPGSDKSPHTTRWTGTPSGMIPRNEGGQ